MKFFFSAALLVLIFCACSGLEHTQKERIKKNNEVEELIYRHHEEKAYPRVEYHPRTREKYPWEEEYIGLLPKITKEYFRCRGRIDHPEKTKTDSNGRLLYYHDCGGIEKHSLPVQNGKEFVYPILIDLLNHIQKRLRKRVVITCGHRCPKHNAYAEDSGAAKYSKHLVGAEVDFYVEGWENRPKEVVRLIKEYYQKHPDYRDRPEYIRFFEEEGGKAMHNKEISIKISGAGENRDFDNRHPYPYLTLEVKYDPQTGKRVVYNWHRAFNGYLRN